MGLEYSRTQRLLHFVNTVKLGFFTAFVDSTTGRRSSFYWTDSPPPARSTVKYGSFWDRVVLGFFLTFDRLLLKDPVLQRLKSDSDWTKHMDLCRRRLWPERFGGLLFVLLLVSPMIEMVLIAVIAVKWGVVALMSALLCGLCVTALIVAAILAKLHRKGLQGRG